MKQILIPTILKPDTVNAVKAALKYSGSECAITLLIVHEAGNDFTSAAALRRNAQITKSQQSVLAICRQLISTIPNCSIKVHNQLGISASLVKHILDYFETDLVIITADYKSEKKRLHKQCLQLLLNCKCPILHLGPYCQEQNFNKAFYIEYNRCTIKTDVVTRIIKDISPVETVITKKIFTNGMKGYIPPQLAEAILENNTDLLVETRKQERINLNKSGTSSADKFGLSVLSILEDAL